MMQKEQSFNHEKKGYPYDSQLLEQEIGYHFKNPALLTEALTHSSYANESVSKGVPCLYNERLEFLGDSVLGIITSEYLFINYPELPEGDLTKTRASLVCEEALYDYAGEIHLGDYLRLGRGEEMNRGREHKSILADAFEALLAAIYLDSGISKDTVAKFLLPYIIHAYTAPQNDKTKDYKTLLQQITQQTQGEILEYVLISESGPDHKKVFETEARLNSNIIGRGRGKSKRESEQMAAKQALQLFGKSD